MPPLFSPLAIAPMIDWTHTHFRLFMRMLAPHALLYTDMQCPGAIFNNPARALDFDMREMPLALQLGGSNPDELVRSAIMAEQRGYSEINLNLGCPSDRVQAGRFGACLMKEVPLVSTCLMAIKKAVQIPVSAKIRIGVDDLDGYDFFESFVCQLIDSGVDKLIVHARKAWLKGLSPKQNRTVPPIDYDYVYRVKSAFPNMPIVINGNIQTIDEIKAHLSLVDGVMLGRLACQNPYGIAEIHHALYPNVPLLSRLELAVQYFDYIHQASLRGVPLSLLFKPIFNLSFSLPGGKRWRSSLMHMQRVGLSDLMIQDALEVLSVDVSMIDSLRVVD
jgi:tRNA-dihydrouridine synthase A